MCSQPRNTMALMSHIFHVCSKESMFWMSPICLKTYCVRTSQQNFMFTTNWTI